MDAVPRDESLRPALDALAERDRDFAEAYALYRGAAGDAKRMGEYRKLYPNRFAIIDEMLGR